MIDLNEAGRIIGIEVLDASKNMGQELVTKLIIRKISNSLKLPTSFSLFLRTKTGKLTGSMLRV
jgi:hypothetical protein